MARTDRMRINDSKVVHETIDGETIIIDLQTGTYYSLRGSASEVWLALHRRDSLGDIVGQMTSTYQGSAEQIEDHLTSFINELRRDELLLPVDPDGTAETPAGRKTAEVAHSVEKPPFERPVLTKYTDMKDVLLLDPIHEVDETGWPSPRKNPPQQE